jgi:hypothetical protein
MIAPKSLRCRMARPAAAVKETIAGDTDEIVAFI